MLLKSSYASLNCLDCNLYIKATVEEKYQNGVVKLQVPPSNLPKLHCLSYLASKIFTVF